MQEEIALDGPAGSQGRNASTDSPPLDGHFRIS
jgi:hypothetical protein